MVDPIADFLTRIKNASKVKNRIVRAPLSKIKIAIAKILKEKNLIEDFKIISTSRGMMTDEEARKRKLGGEIICEIY